MSLVHSYHEMAEGIVSKFGVDKFVHVNAGLLIWCVSAFVTDRSIKDVRNLKIVGFAALANEVMDYLDGTGWTLSDTLGDVAATLFWPVALTLMLNFGYSLKRDYYLSRRKRRRLPKPRTAKSLEMATEFTA